MQIVQKNTKRRYAVPDIADSNSAPGPPKKKSKKGGKSGEATRNEASATQAESGPSCPLVYTGETRVVPPLRKSGKVDVFDNLNINEDVLMKMLEGTDLPEAPPSHKYNLNKKSEEQLYKDILSVTDYKDNDSTDNFKLNSEFMSYIKSRAVIYGNLLGNKAKRLDFFKKVFKSVFFIKHFLIVKSTNEQLKL